MKLTESVEHLTKIGRQSIFYTKVANKAVCLLCGQSVAVLKEYNISRHYAMKHGNYGNNLSAVERQTRATELDRKLARQQNVFAKGN